MPDPSARRPYMPGYGVKGPEEGSGLLPWSWAEERLRSSRDYWVVTLWPDGRPHAMPVWGVWDDEDLFWFTSAVGSRKARNVARDPRCVVMTEDPENPVTLEGVAQIRTSRKELEHVLRLVNSKYGTKYDLEMLRATVNATIRVRPTWAFGLATSDFTGSPTRWAFPSDNRS
jgi:PPOX class probable F420-dependent enzyme